MLVPELGSRHACSRRRGLLRTCCIRLWVRMPTRGLPPLPLFCESSAAVAFLTCLNLAWPRSRHRHGQRVSRGPCWSSLPLRASRGASGGGHAHVQASACPRAYPGSRWPSRNFPQRASRQPGHQPKCCQPSLASVPRGVTSHGRKPPRTRWWSHQHCTAEGGPPPTCSTPCCTRQPATASPYCRSLRSLPLVVGSEHAAEDGVVRRDPQDVPR